MVRAVHLRVLPETRGECRNGARPCPLVSCRFHLLLDVASDGRLYKTHDFDEHDAESLVGALAAMPETCALDVADSGGRFGEEVASLLNMTHLHVADIETAAKRKIREGGYDLDDKEHPDDPYLWHMYPKGSR